jgi:hypothetical protein
MYRIHVLHNKCNILYKSLEFVLFSIGYFSLFKYHKNKIIFFLDFSFYLANSYINSINHLINLMIFLFQMI